MPQYPNKIKHILDGAGLQPEDRASGRIENERCYRLMRSHTARLGKINMIKAENRGKANRRVYFSQEV